MASKGPFWKKKGGGLEIRGEEQGNKEMKGREKRGEGGRREGNMREKKEGM